MTGRFTKNFAVMAAGSGIAYAIPLLVLPVLSRLYTPEQFGVVGTVSAVAVLIALVVTLRYELAIVLPQNDDQADTIAASAAALAVFLTAAAAAVLYVLKGSLGQEEQGLRELANVFWLIPPYVVLQGWTQIGLNLSNRYQQYATISAASICQQVSVAATAILLGLLGKLAVGLVVARVVGQVFSVLVLATAHVRWIRDIPRSLRNPQRLALLKEHYRFPIFNVPYSLLGTFSREALVLLFTGSGNVIAAGYYGLARMLLLAPASLLTASLSQLFYREAAFHADPARFVDFTYALQRFTAIASALPFGFLTIYGPETISLLFGQEWREAGRYAAILSPAAALAMLTSWPERIFEVRRRQSLALLIQVIFDGASIFSVALLLYAFDSPYAAIIAFALVHSSYHCFYLAAVYRLVGIRLTALAVLLGKASIVFVVPAALDVVLRYAELETTLRILVVAAVCSVVYGVTMAMGTRRVLRVVGV